MRRLLLAGTAVTLVAASGVAFAAPKPKPVCNLVTDAKGDATIPTSTALDVVSADISTGSKNVKGVVRLAKIGGDAAVAHGQQYKINFEAGGVNHFLRVQNITGLGPTYSYGYQGPDGSVVSGTASGKIDAARNEVTFTAPKSLFKGVKGGTVKNVVGGAYVFAGAVFQAVDTATSTATYKDMTPSCIGNS